MYFNGNISTIPNNTTKKQNEQSKWSNICFDVWSIYGNAIFRIKKKPRRYKRLGLIKQIKQKGMVNLISVHTSD